MSTLTTYQTALDAKGYDALSTTVKQAAIQEARRRIFMARRWSWLETTSTALATVAGTETVSLATITDLAHIDAVRLSDATGRLPVEFRPYDEIRVLQDEDVTHPWHGTHPFFWSRRGANLVFYPTPTRALTVTVEYAKAAADLAAHPAVDTIPDRNQDLVVWAAVVPLAFRQRQLQESSAADQYFTKVLLPQHAGQDGVEQRQTSRQIRTGYWG